MEAIRIKTRLESEDLHLPQLRPLIGKEVEIVVTEQENAPQAEKSMEEALRLAELVGDYDEEKFWEFRRRNRQP